MRSNTITLTPRFTLALYTVQKISLLFEDPNSVDDNSGSGDDDEDDHYINYNSHDSSDSSSDDGDYKKDIKSVKVADWLEELLI